MTAATTQRRNLTMPTAAEIAAVSKATAIERQWYAGWHRYQDNDAVRQGIAQGTLVSVTETPNGKPIQRLTSTHPKHVNHWCYLGRGALGVMHYMGQQWRNELNERGIDPKGELRLAYTSLVRTVAYQQEVIASGALAVPDSTHEVAGAFDTDASSYYRRLSDGRYQSIPHPDRPLRQVAAIGDVLRPSDQMVDTTPEPRPDLYDPNVTDALLVVARRLAEDGIVNNVVEFAGTFNQCTHTAANPQSEFVQRLARAA